MKLSNEMPQTKGQTRVPSQSRPDEDDANIFVIMQPNLLVALYRFVRLLPL